MTDGMASSSPRVRAVFKLAVEGRVASRPSGQHLKHSGPNWDRRWDSVVPLRSAAPFPGCG
jgi:hypothetical protein